jgi:hypothetical protein
MDTTHEAKSSKRLRLHFCRRRAKVTRGDAQRKGEEEREAGGSMSPAIVS